MSESLRNDGRVWVPKKKGDNRRPNDIPENERDYYLERRYPSFGNLVPRDVASRAAKEVCDEGRGVGPGGYGVYLDFRDAIERLGLDQIREKYGNLFEIYERITGEDAYQTPDANLPGGALHDGRPLGRLRLDVQYSRGSLSPARPTSPTREPIAWGPAPRCKAWPTVTSSCRAPCPTTWRSTKLEKVDTSQPRVPGGRRPKSRLESTRS